MPHDFRRTLFEFASISPNTGLGILVSRLATAFAAAARGSEHDSESAADDGYSRFSRLQVLVVDDNPAHVGNACELLGHFGVVPMLAADGAEAVALASCHEFDMILMDLQMPVLGGIAATQQIRRFETEQPSAARATILAFTSRVLEDDVMKHCGFDGVLEEPCNLQTLQECLLRWAPQGHRPAPPNLRPVSDARSSPPH